MSGPSLSPEFKAETARLLDQVAREADEQHDRLLHERVITAREAFVGMRSEHSDPELRATASSAGASAGAEQVRLHRALAERCSQAAVYELAVRIREQVAAEAERTFGPDDPRTREERSRLRGSGGKPLALSENTTPATPWVEREWDT